MENHQESRYVKRTQKDYSMSFKLQIVPEIDRGQLTTTEATKKYSIQCRKTVIKWLKNLVILIGRTKPLSLWQNYQNKRLWSLKLKSSF